MALTIRPNRYQEIPNGPFGFKKAEAEVETEVETKSIEEDAPAESKKRKVRARTDDGHFVKDDPATPENEAWVEIEGEGGNEAEAETAEN